MNFIEFHFNSFYFYFFTLGFKRQFHILFATSFQIQYIISEWYTLQTNQACSESQS